MWLNFRLLFLLVACAIINASDEKKVVADNTFGGNCNRDSLAVYKVELEGHWSEKNFPRHYPKIRPPAHFSKTFGVSHNESFKLFGMNELANEGIISFCLTGDSDELENDLNDEVFDEFNIAKLDNPIDKIESRLFVNSNFSIVSLVTKLQPSPDWIVGIESLNLCRDDRWVERISMEVRPLDCGVNSGFTFSAPIFKTNPQEEINEITPNFHGHESSSFYYENIKRLPAIAYFRFHKIKEYVGVKETSVRRIHQKYRRHDKNSTRRQRRRHRHGPKKSENEIQEVLNNSINDNESPDCVFSNWNAWSKCSTGNCGIGHMSRNRTIIRLNKKGGSPCGQLTERKWCGSSRCRANLDNEPISNSSYFRW